MCFEHGHGKCRSQNASQCQSQRPTGSCSHMVAKETIWIEETNSLEEHSATAATIVAKSSYYVLALRLWPSEKVGVRTPYFGGFVCHIFSENSCIWQKGKGFSRHTPCFMAYFWGIAFANMGVGVVEIGLQGLFHESPLPSAKGILGPCPLSLHDEAQLLIR